MNEPSTNKSIIFLIVITLAANATLLVGTISYCVIQKIEPNAVLLTAVIALVNYILGAISGMLVKTSPTAATPTDGTPAKVVVENKPDNPVATEEV